MSLTYSQFIHGKIVGQGTYRIVACTPDLAGRIEELESLAQKYRFWGARPPAGQPLAVGIAPRAWGERLLLVQATPALLDNGQPALDNQGRPFTQHRYVIIPPESLDRLRGRLWWLLNWVMEQGPAPVFRNGAGESQLAPLAAPTLNGADVIDTAGETEKLRRALSLRGDGAQPVLLSALAALINRRRVLFDAALTGQVYSEDLLEGVLLLLPAAWRGRVALAAGVLDEGVCRWANLLVKTNGSPQAPLPADLVWLKRASHQFYGQVNGQALESGYTSLIRPLATDTASLPRLIRILDDVVDAGEIEPELHDGRLALRLIPALPDSAEREEAWRTALTGLAPADWEAVLPAVVDEVGQQIAWQQLKRSAVSRPDDYAPLVFRLWRSFEPEALARLWQDDLVEDPPLAEALLRAGLLDQVVAGGPAADLRPALHRLCRAVLAHKAGREPAGRRGADALAAWLLAHGPFDEPVERFTLLDAALGEAAPAGDLLARFDGELASLLPFTPEAVLDRSNLLAGLRAAAPAVAGLLEQVAAGQDEALDYLPHLAHHAGLDRAGRERLYAAALAAWTPSYEAARGLLTDLLLQSLAAHRAAGDGAAWSWRAALGDLGDWFQTRLPAEMVGLLDWVENDPDWDAWRELAAALLDTALARARFLDEVTGGHPPEPLLETWLPVLGESAEARVCFAESHTWRRLRRDGPAWLGDALAALLGWQERPIIDLVPLLERVQQRFRLPLGVLGGFLEQISESERLSADQLAVLLSTYLPYGQAVNLAQSRLWGTLQQRSAELAQFFRDLQANRPSRSRLKAVVAANPEHAPILVRWLRANGRLNWINGPLLHALIDGWLAQGQADPDLVSLLTNPAVTAGFKPADWLAMMRLCWLPGHEELRPEGKWPALKPGEQAQLAQYAREMVRRYTHPAQTQRLLDDCLRWGLDRAAQEAILSAAPPAACSVGLLSRYLAPAVPSAGGIEPEGQRPLLELALQLAPRDDVDQARLKALLVEAVARHLQNGHDPAWLAHWHELAADRNVYVAAFGQAARRLAPTHFNHLVAWAHRLVQEGLAAEGEAIEQALGQYWEAERRKLAAVKMAG